MKQVYLLSDPITELPKYIGSTKLKMSLRLYHHIYNEVNNKEKKEWLLSLRAQGLSPVITILEDYCEGYELLEAMYVQEFRGWGFKLFNKSKDGRIGYFRTKAQNEQMSKTLMGNRVSQKTRDAVSASNKIHLRRSTEVVNLQTGIFYDTIREAAEAHNMVPQSLSSCLRTVSNPYKNIYSFGLKTGSRSDRELYYEKAFM